MIGFFRYNGFFVLYPVGVSGELMCCYQVWLRLSQIENENVKPFTITLPNTYNFCFSFESFIKYGIPICYLNFPPMFMHMVRQRAKYYKNEQVKHNKEILHVPE
jgi:very-long-chain (3R)-3-hydroxyacyl-CoA dehydratase